MTYQTGLFFVTAQNADSKQINRLLVYLRDWIDDCANDYFRLATTRNAFDLDKPDDTVRFEPTVPPVQHDIDNTWKGASLADVEGFVLDVDKSNHKQGVNSSCFVLLDDKGLQDCTCIVGERRLDDETDEPIDEFDKVRVPWDETYNLWSFLDSGVMDLEDWCGCQDPGRDRDEDGFYANGDVGAAVSEQNARKRAEEIERLEREGKA